MSQLDLYRFIESMDIEDVALKDRADYNVVDSGEWLIPGDFSLGIPTWSRVISGRSLTDNAKRLAQMVWMEKGRTDARAVGKVSTIFGGGVRGRTDVFKLDDTYTEGDNLTISADSEGKIIFSKAGSGDVVKAICLVSNQNDPDGLLHFELVD